MWPLAGWTVAFLQKLGIPSYLPVLWEVVSNHKSVENEADGNIFGDPLTGRKRAERMCGIWASWVLRVVVVPWHADV